MVTGEKPPIGVVAPNPGIATEIAGVPATMPGGNDGKDKTTMTGRPATVAVAPAPVSPDLQGGPHYVAADPGKTATTATTANDAGADGPSASTDTEAAASLSPEEQAKADATAGTDRKIAAFREYIDRLPELETPEKRAKRERQEKSKRIIGAVSDGLRAMSNLWFTSQYAPDMYNHEKDSQLKETNRWIDKAKAEREKLQEEHLRYAIGLGDAENDRARTLRELEEQQERQRLAREKAEREAEQHEWAALLQPDKQREQAGKATKAEQEAIAAQAEAENAPAMQAARLDTEKARAGAQRAAAAAHNRSNPKEFTAWDERGNPHSFRTEAAATLYAKQHGTYKETEASETTMSKKWINDKDAGDKTETTRTKKTGHAGKPDPTGMDDPTA